MQLNSITLLICLFIACCGQAAKKTPEKKDTGSEEDIIIPTEKKTKTITKISIETAQTLFFTKNAVQLEALVTYSDNSTRPNDSALTWKSSDSDIANINNDGELTPIKPGQVDITLSASDEEDALSITVLPGKLGFTLWVGEKDAEFYLDDIDTEDTLTLYTSKTKDCAPKDCDENTTEELSPNEKITIKEHSVKAPQFYQVTMGDHSSISTTTDASNLFSPRNFFQAVAFNKKILVISGKSVDDTYLSDTWSSKNGNSWTLEQEKAEFTGRENHRVTVFKESLYLAGGWDGGKTLFHDVWKSPDGNAWEAANIKAEFPARDSHQIVALGDKLFIIGGWTEENECDALNDVWQSADGTSWEAATQSAEFSKRCSHQVTPLKDKLYITGGLEGKDSTRKYLNDVWSSSDGKKWQKETDSAAFAPRFKHQVTVFNDALFLSGGFSGNSEETYFNDIWSSSNGKEWTLMTKSAGFEPRANHQMVALGDYLYVISGRDKNTHYHDIWRSKDGKKWQKHQRGEFIFGGE